MNLKEFGKKYNNFFYPVNLMDIITKVLVDWLVDP